LIECFGFVEAGAEQKSKAAPRRPRARRYETGVYADEVLQHYFPPSMAVIANIAAG
jgi:hypothetical protein